MHALDLRVRRPAHGAGSRCSGTRAVPRVRVAVRRGHGFEAHWPADLRTEDDPRASGDLAGFAMATLALECHLHGGVHGPGRQDWLQFLRQSTVSHRRGLWTRANE